MGNKGLLTIIAVILIGILAVMIIQVDQEPDSLGEQVSETFKKIGDEIDSNSNTIIR